MAVSTVFGPRYSPAFGGTSYTDMRWTQEKDLVGNPIDARLSRIRSAVNRPVANLSRRAQRMNS
jgi:hypothetical protein